MSVSNNEITVATLNVPEHTHFLNVYNNGQFKNFKFRPSEGDRYLSLCYDQSKDNIVGFYVAKNKIFVEYLSGQTGKLQEKCLLSTVHFPKNIYTFHLICHTNGTLALTDGKHIILLHEKALVM